jgi:hypothetical protein
MGEHKETHEGLCTGGGQVCCPEPFCAKSATLRDSARPGAQLFKGKTLVMLSVYIYTLSIVSKL